MREYEEIIPTETLRCMGESLCAAGKALGDFCRAFAEAVSAIVNGVNFKRLKRVVEVQAALTEAPPRVRRLALYGKKYRTRKKNINRALREKAKREI